MKLSIFKKALFSALATISYIVMVVLLISSISNILGPEKEDTIIAPIIMLSLFVLSAAVTGSLVFGRPVMWYLDGRKKEALYLLAYTLGAFLVVTAIALIILLIV